MYFKRKIDNALDSWLQNENKSPALVVGIRQCGKTETIQEFAKRNNLQLIEINFWTNPEFCFDFEGKLDVDTIITNISLRFPNLSIKPKKLLFFLMKFKIALEQDYHLKILKMMEDIMLLEVDHI